MNYLSLQVDAAGIALITLDNPYGSMNVVSPPWIDEFFEVIHQVTHSPQIKGAVVTSAKASFMAGADLQFLADSFERMSRADAFAFSQRASLMHRRLETCGKPVAAAINGMALGGGFELCLACHYRVISNDADALVGLPEVTVGLLPGSGGTQRLPRLIGIKNALPLLLEGKKVAPQVALEMGLVHAVVPPDQVVAAARAWVASGAEPVQPWDRSSFVTPGGTGLRSAATADVFMAQAPMIVARHGRNYPAPMAIVAAVFEGLQVPFDTGLRIESKFFASLMIDPVARNVIRTTFINRRQAERLVRRPKSVPVSTVRTLGVLGAGMMGAGIAHAAAISGIDVVVLDTTLEAANQAKAHTQRILESDVRKGRRSETEVAAIVERIRPVEDYSLLRDCDFVIECVFESVEVKADVTRRAEAVIRDSSVFATNTSTLPIGSLAKASSRQQSFIGLHFFSPVERMALVEVIVGAATSQATLARALDLVRQLGKVPIVVTDSRGFYTSRVFQTFIHEGAAMLGEGVSPALIENAAKMAGMPVGPLALLDEVTLELPIQIIAQAKAQEGSSYQPPCGERVMRRMLDHGRAGRRAGGGFYEYPEGAPKHLWRGLAELFPRAAVEANVDELKKRLLYIQALEAARCLEEGVISHAADGDLGSVLGWGFPSYTGGALSLIEQVGVADFVAHCELYAKRYGPRFKPSDWLRERAARNEKLDEATEGVACAG